MWFWNRKEIIDEFESDLSSRIVEIQSRITALRSSLESSNRSYKNASTSSQPTVAAETTLPTKTNKEQEMMALKAKLLGKKS